MSTETITARGVQLPEVDGRRSSTQLSRDVLAHATAEVDPELSAAVAAEGSWHTAYPHHLRTMTARAAASGAAASTIARAGLDRLHAQFEYIGADGVTRRLDEAVSMNPASPLGRRVVQGDAQRSTELMVPYRGRELRGADITTQARRWADAGVVEPSFVDVIDRVVGNPEWLDLRGRTFALLGAGAEMGPTELLLSWGANVHAVDIPSARVWDRLTAMATAGAGRLHVPVRADGTDGCDLLTDTAAIRLWLTEVEGPMVLGNYTYMDGADFVRVAMAADAVNLGMLRARDDVSLAYLATPTDVFAVPPEAVAHARARQVEAGLSGTLAGVTNRLSGGRAFVPAFAQTVTAEDGRELGIADCIVVQQGPNYALAKRLQRWRALIAKQDGVASSVHVAPATRTASVTKNKVLAAAYAGAHVLGVEPFEPATSRAVMAALLVHDLRHGEAGEAGEGTQSEHDLTAAAAHSGLWRMAWEPRSALGVAVGAGARALLPV